MAIAEPPVKTTPLTDMLENWWTDNKFFTDDFTDEEGRFCILGAISPEFSENNNFYASYPDVADRIYDFVDSIKSRGIFISEVNDKKGRKTVLEMIRSVERLDGT